jgi:hypothetical protein
LYALAVQLHRAGATPTYDRLMLVADDPRLKSLLVDLDEEARQKADSDVAQRLHDLIHDRDRRLAELRHRSAIADLNERRLDEDQELETLRSLYHDFGRRQAGSPPTEG